MDLRKAAEMALETLCVGANDAVPNDIDERFEQAIQALRQALAQPEQEPVAWVYNGILHEFDPSEFATSEVKPLYTAPPKREWVGITYDEVYEFVCTTDSYINLARAIEAKLKEKNT